MLYLLIFVDGWITANTTPCDSYRQKYGTQYSVYVFNRRSLPYVSKFMDSYVLKLREVWHCRDISIPFVG